LKDNTITENWYYVIVQDPGTSKEQFVGFSQEDTDEKFLPAFKTKQDAEKCFTLMPRDVFKKKYDSQAIIEEDLILAAAENGHRIFLLDEKGCLLKPLN
jgi:hypothetical protein